MLRDAGADLLEEVPEVVGGRGEDDLVRVEGGAPAARQSDVSHVAAPEDLSVLVFNSIEPNRPQLRDKMDCTVRVNTVFSEIH